MVSIIKNQLLKHLSRFTKNLSADKINLSTFKGEGELSNLELDEEVLTDLLELPSWLRLTSAWCNRVTIRIQWTKLKSVPILLTLDEVKVQVETCEELRTMSSLQGLSSISGPAKYSFIHKVIDGMTVAVNTVIINFKSLAFQASIQIINILVESKSPVWKRCDLRMTRLKDSSKGQLLIFKELEWQTVRMEARSTENTELTTCLRLITNRARCRIIMKKRISDSLLLGSCLTLISDDLIWVLTDSQLKAALHFLSSLAGLVQQATEQTRVRKAARKLEVVPEYQSQVSQQQERLRDSGTASSCVFKKYDFVETSYHVILKHVDIHFCDDPGPGRSSHPELKDGGALQVNFQHIQVDYYPYHLAMGDRKLWLSYQELSIPHTEWLRQALTSFHSKLMDLIDREARHTPLGRSSQQSPIQESMKSSNVKTYIQQEFDKLMTSCIILRVKDFTLYQVTTSERKQKPKLLVAAQQLRKSHGQGDRTNLGDRTSIIHAEFTYYYYPGDKPFPLPSPKLYIQVNPIQINFDLRSCLWANAFVLNLKKSLEEAQPEQIPDIFYIDVKLEAIKIMVSVDATSEYPNQRDRPQSLQIQVERVSLTNVRTLEFSSRADLAKCVDSLQSAPLLFGVDFPSMKTDKHVVTDKFLSHIQASDNIRPSPKLPASSIQELERAMSRTLLWTEARDMWCITLDPLCLNFAGAPADLGKVTPFVDAFQLTLWAHLDLLQMAINALVHIPGLVSVQLNHYQYLFLLRAAEQLGELAAVMAVDSQRVNADTAPTILAGILLPQVEVTFVMASQTPGQECHGSGDLDSVVPDSSSIPEEVNRLSLPSSPSFDGPVILPLTPAASRLSIPNNLNVGIKTMTKGLKGLVNSLDLVMKASPDEAGSDIASQRSDASSDSEKFVLDQQAEGLDGMLRTISMQEMWEIASEVTEDGNPSIMSGDHSPDDSSGRRKDLISLATIKLGQVALVQQSQGFESLLKLQIANIMTDECGAIPLDEFQNKFGCRSRAWMELPQNSEGPKVSVRLHHSIEPKDDVHPRIWGQNNLQAQITNVVLDLNISTLVGLADLLEDEIHPRPILLEALLKNIDLNLNDDRLPANITSPGPMPLHVKLSELQLRCDREGCLFVEIPKTDEKKNDPEARGISSTVVLEPQMFDNTKPPIQLPSNNYRVQEVKLATEVKQLKDSNKRLGDENSELRRRLDRVQDENISLRRTADECEALRKCLVRAQKSVEDLLDEKNVLLQQIQVLQKQIELPNRTKR